MSFRKWLFITLSLLSFPALVVTVNLCVDHHSARLSLFSLQKDISQAVEPEGRNNRLYKPAYIFRFPDRHDSFIFGSSLTSFIRVEQIPDGRYYNVSYTVGVPAQHLAILKAFLKKGVKIKNVVIGLDGFAFNAPEQPQKMHLQRIMHPNAGGPSRLEIFGLYFFRKPSLQELALWKDRLLTSRGKGVFFLNNQDEFIDQLGKPIFNFTVSQYEPLAYDVRSMDEAFRTIDEIKTLAHKHDFSLVFFINPFYAQSYISNAEALFGVKERLASLTDYYDFSGFNSVTTNAMNYYEPTHYRFRVGDMIVKRIFGAGSASVPADFGVLVTRKNANRHLENQRQELARYLRESHLQP